MCSEQTGKKKRNLAKDANQQPPQHVLLPILRKHTKMDSTKPLQAWTNQHERYLSSNKK